jgi:integrase/recombinase XerC
MVELARVDHLVAEDVVEGNPMPAIDKPKRERGPVKYIRGNHVVDRLLETAARSEPPKSRIFWPARDVALCRNVRRHGIRLAEATALNLSSIERR